MDVLKLLTRSTKHSKKSSQQPSLPKTPSTGQSDSPQLFRDHARGTASQEPPRKKRKGRHFDGDLPTELNFFADARPTKGGDKTKIAHAAAVNSQSAKQAPADSAEIAPDVDLADWSPVGEQECKTILHTHKIKITVLAGEEQNRRYRKHEKHKKTSRSRDADETKHKKKTELYPEPLQDFAQLRKQYNVHQRIVENIKEQAYVTPTEVQLGSLPLLLRSNHPTKSGSNPAQDIPNLLVVAPTGSGKTLAFLIPAIDAIAKLKLTSNGGNQASSDNIPPRAVVIAPTKELAAQIANEGRKLSQGTKVSFALMRKGMEVVKRGHPMKTAQEDSDFTDEHDNEEVHRSEHTESTRMKTEGQLTKADILVSTPLALANALMDTNGTMLPLRGVKYLILDEADVLLDPLFRDQTLSIWRSCTCPSIRVSLWSATIGSNVESLVTSTIASQRKLIATSSSNTNDLPRPSTVRIVIGLKDTAVPNVSHKLIYCATEPGKLLAVRQLLRPSSSTDYSLRPPFLIFTQTIPRALALHAELQYDIPPEAGGSARIAVLHANLSESMRAQTLARFRKGEVWILVTTDLLARGVDFRGLNGVINYDAPTSAATYVHRVGRTGRAGRDGGIAVTLWAKEDVSHMKSITNVIAAAEKVRGKVGTTNGREVDGGDVGSQLWLFDSLPTPSKNAKQSLRKRGVEARRPEAKMVKGVGKISTKTDSRRRINGQETIRLREANESDFEGFSS